MVITGELTCKPQERLFYVIHIQDAHSVVLHLVAVAIGGLRFLDLAIFAFVLVSHEADGDSWRYASEFSVKNWYITIASAIRGIEHDNRALRLHIASCADVSVWFMPHGIPDVEFQEPTVGMDDNRMDIDMKCGHV